MTEWLDLLNLAFFPLAGVALGAGGAGGAAGFLSSLGGFGNIAGKLLPGLFGGLGGAAALGALNQGRDDIMALPGTDPLSLQGSFGSSFGATGQSSLSPEALMAQASLGGAIPGLLSGGFANLPGVQEAQSQAGLGLGSAFQNFNNVLGQQQGSQAFGGLQGLFSGSQGLGNIFANQAAQGPQDFSGGAQNALFAGGLGQLNAAGNQSALFNQSLNTQRQAATQGGLLDRAINSLQNRQFATGRLGSTGGAQETQAFLDSVARQDLGFQNNAFNQAQSQQELLGRLGQGQIGLGSGLLSTNLNQFNTAGRTAGDLFGLAGQLEGQGFNQQLGALRQNQTAGQQRLAAAQGLLGFTDNLFGSNFDRGLGATQGLLGLGNLGLDVARTPFELQASLLGAGGARAGALADIATARANASGGLFGGIGDALGGLFG